MKRAESPEGPPYRDVTPDEAERLVREGAVRVLDVRTPWEWSGLGHIPGATLLPIDQLSASFGTLERDGKPLLVCCEHGVRSEAAAAFLVRKGFHEVLNLAGGMSCWKGPREHGESR